MLLAIAALSFAATTTFAGSTVMPGDQSGATPQQQTPPDCKANPKDPRCKDKDK
jgi:hypothetical protein